VPTTALTPAYGLHDERRRVDNRACPHKPVSTDPTYGYVTPIDVLADGTGRDARSSLQGAVRVHQGCAACRSHARCREHGRGRAGPVGGPRGGGRRT
jgi:hypothetical protein